ncbi:hypothetical protein KIN20_033464 [Parelaphostrongylus tenuis]|nr:hypothetical protein KIN20_033464 [Parelaphostrongylus tenuis]
MEPCHNKVQALNYHCLKLARCCPDADICRNELSRSEAARTLRRRKESLAAAVMKCHTDTYKNYHKHSTRSTTTVSN